ncbi:MAG: OmpH family outer membrane protein [Lewinellaceae bacterium]|nr:OmpH family outer membrane protein [Lewinellaceae bacterium]
MKHIFLLCTFLVAMTSVAQAQKYGHMNFGNFIAELADTKKANIDLEEYQKTLVAKGEEMANKFKANYVKFLTDVQGGDLSPKQQQEMQAALEAEQNAIRDYESEITTELQKKREELLQPILDSVEAAIADVAKENNYQLIFDTSVFNAILFTQESDDVSALVKAKYQAKKQ